MSAQERQQQFEVAIRALPETLPEARIAKNFGFSNSARVIEGGLFACTNNLEAYSAGLAADRTAPLRQFVFLCVLTFPPQDEVYFAVTVRSDVGRLNGGLLKLFREGEARNAQLTAAGQGAGKISNNVKFYLTETGHIWFHNYDFRESLRDGPDGPVIDPDCLAKVDSIHFAVWPPAVSVQRSLLARAFVGFLGSLTGREKVHELQVWEQAGSVSPAMQRMPETIELSEIEAAIAAAGGHYPGGEIHRYHAALNFLPDKHFVILAGLSGTGKTRLAIDYACAVHGVGAPADDPFLFICPVRPEWTDPAGLTGYYDVLSDRYVVPPFLQAVLLATAHRNSPVFVILDEMNLARVEYYFSDVLSAIETGGSLQLHAHGVPLEGSTGTTVPAALPVPPNLYITGTINIDETTNPVSDKVLDRAMVIDMSKVDLAGYLARLISDDPALEPACQACQDRLLAVHEAMTVHGPGFGYRVTKEFLSYHSFAAASAGSDAVTDHLMVQKVLVKLRGSERQRPLLTSLAKILAGLPESQALIGRLLADLDEYGSFQASR